MSGKRVVLADLMAVDAEKRQEAYRNISNMCGEEGAGSGSVSSSSSSSSNNNNSLEWKEYMSAVETMKVVHNLKLDLSSHNEREVVEAAGTCVHLLTSPSFLTDIDAGGQKGLYDALFKILKTSKDRKLLNIVLQSLAKSRLKKEVYVSNLQENFDILCVILQIKDVSPTVFCEALQVVLVVFNANPHPCIEIGRAWFPSTFSRMFHANAKVRKSALAITRRVRETMEEVSNNSVKSDLVRLVLPDLKDKYCKDMVNLVMSGSLSVLQPWREVVALLGIELHSRRYLINSLLNVLEKAFKIADPMVRVESFNTWRVIIDNFALDSNTFTNPRKLHLLLTPFRMTNARTEDTCNAKLEVWWHLVCLLAHKKHLVANFDQVVVPLLQFCFIGDGNKSRNLIMSGAVSSPHRTFTGLHTTHAEVLAQILATDATVPKYKHTLPIIAEHVMSPVVFLRHYPLLLKCFGEALQTLSFKDDQQSHLGLAIFSHLLSHVRTVTTADVEKKEAVDAVRELFNTLSHIETLCHPGDSQSQFLFQCFSLLTLGDLALPKKVLNSHQYHIPTSQDIMCGTLSNHLITHLCRPALLHHSLHGTEFIKVWNAVLENSQPVTGKLRFLEAVIEELSVSAITFLCPEHPAVLCHLWTTVLRQMVTHINQAQSSECDDSEPDWSSVYSVLLFPLLHATDTLTCASFDVFQQIMDVWKKLWKKFTLITSTTPSVEPNSEVEHVASTLLALCQDKASDVADVHLASYVLTAEVLVLLTDTFQYVKLGKAAEQLASSPAKAKRKPHRLHNLSSTLDLTLEVFVRTCSIVSARRMHVADKLCQAILTMTKGIQHSPMKYQQEFIKHTTKILIKSVRVNPAVVFDFKVERKCINMVKEYSNLVKIYITHKGVSEGNIEHLNALEPLFSAAYTSTNKKIREEVQRMLEGVASWLSEAGLDIPPFLLVVQRKWGVATPESAAVDEFGSMEDFIDATPKEKRTNSSSTKAPTPRSSTPLSTKKQNAERTDKNEEKHIGGGVSTPPTRYSSRVRKVEVKQGKKKKSGGAASTSSTPTPTPTTPQPQPSTTSSSSRVSSSTPSTDTTVTRIIRTCRNAPSSSPSPSPTPQNIPKHNTTTSSSSTPLDDKQQNKHGGDRNAPTTPDINEPVVTSSTEIEKEGKKASLVTSSSSDVEVVNSMKPERKQLYNDDQDSDSSEQSLSSSSKDKTHKRGREDEDLCTVLHDTSLAMQELLHERSLDEETGEKSEDINAQASSPNLMEGSEETSQHGSSSVTKKKRINFMEVVVSPSVVRDVRLTGQKPKVKIASNVTKVKESTPATLLTLSTNDLEDEMVDLSEVTKPNEDPACVTEESGNTDKQQLKKTLTDKPTTEKEAEGNASEGSTSRGKRKRKLFTSQQITDTSVKKRKTDDSNQEDNNDSLEDSITVIGSNSNSNSYSEDILPKKSPKPFRKTRSHPGTLETEKDETKTKSAFSPKVTRSGRKIVAPNKDMPEPMTPPKKARKRLHKNDSKEDESDVSIVDLSNVSSPDENTESLASPLASGPESVKGVDKVNVMESEGNKCEKVNDKTNKTDLESMSVSIIEQNSVILFEETIVEENEKKVSYTTKPNLNLATHKDKQQQQEQKTHANEKENEEEQQQEQKTHENEKENEEEQQQEQKTHANEKGNEKQQPPPQRKTYENKMKNKKKQQQEKTHDNEIENEEKQEEKTHENKTENEEKQEEKTHENKTENEEKQEEKTHENEQQQLVKTHNNKTEENNEKQQQQQTPDHNKEMDVSQDLTDLEKTSEESTQMECGQDLEGEVSYPAARRGTEVMEDRASAEGEDQPNVNVPQHTEDEGTGVQMIGLDDKLKTTDDNDVILLQEDEEEEEEDKSSSEEDELEGEVEKRDSPTSPEPEVEEEEEYLSAGQEEKDNDKKEEEGQERKMKMTDVDKIPQETPHKFDKDLLLINSQEQDKLERTNHANNKKFKSESNTENTTEPSLSEKTTTEDIKKRELQDTDTPVSEGEEDQRRESVSSKEVKVMQDSNVKMLKDVMVLKDPRRVSAEEKSEAQQHTTQNELQEVNVSVSMDVRDSKMSEDVPGATKDSDEIDKTVACSSVCEEDKESRQTALTKKQLEDEEDNVFEEVTSGNKSSHCLRKEVEDRLPQGSMSDVSEAVLSPSNNVEVMGVVVACGGTHDADEMMLSPSQDVNTLHSGKQDQGKQTVSSPSKTNTLSSPRKSEKVSSPRKNEKVSSPKKSEKVSSPRKNEKVSSPKKSEKVSSPRKGEKHSSPKKREKFSSPRKNEKVSSPRKSEKLSSPRKSEAFSSPEKSEKLSSQKKIETFSSPKKSDTVCIPRKIVEVKVPLPRKTVHMKQIIKDLMESECDKEINSSPIKCVMTTDSPSLLPGRSEYQPLGANTHTNTHKAEEEEEADPKVSQHIDRIPETQDEVIPPTQPPEESPTNTRQQEEELSPDKSSRSKLKLAVSTPERMKQRGALLHPGSRAALLVACAKKNIRKRGGGEAESNANVLTEGGRSRSLGGLSPIRRSVPARPSPGVSPDGRRKSLLDSVGVRPWMKHTPSPNASPSTSILKRTLMSDTPDVDTPSPPAKYRRVSFADPPVSERVEIPPSPRTLKVIRAQKRLDMTRMAAEVKDSDVQAGKKQSSEEKEPEVLDFNNPICTALHPCQDRVEVVAQHLTSPAMLPGLLTSLESLGITTVGQLSKLSEWEVNSLPIKVPKVTNTRKVIQEYEKNWTRDNLPTISSIQDDIDVTLAEMFGELDDKENLRPNHQDTTAAEGTKGDSVVKESVGSPPRTSHSGDIQEIMDMEDITPLYSSSEETEEETLKNLYRRASEDDFTSKKKLLHHLLHTLPSSDVSEAVFQCMKTRISDPPTTTAAAAATHKP